MMHADEVRVGAAVVRRLVDDQFPQWRDLPVREVVTDGTVHAVHRIGDGLAARFPLRGHDVDAARRSLVAEAAAARELAACSPVPTPRPVALGEPGAGYPLPWAVQTWVPGRVAAVGGAEGDTEDDPAGSVAFARDLAGFVTALRGADTRGRRFSGTNRGGDLRRHDDWVQECLRRSAGLLDVGPLREQWSRFRDLPRTDGDVMTHGDLVPGNVLVEGGRLVGVLDVGGFGPADPALDLVAAWHLLDRVPRREFRAVLGCDELQWARGRAWAFEQAVGLVRYYAASAPALSRLGRRTLARLADDAPPQPPAGLTVRSSPPG